MQLTIDIDTDRRAREELDAGMMKLYGLGFLSGRPPRRGRGKPPSKLEIEKKRRRAKKRKRARNTTKASRRRNR